MTDEQNIDESYISKNARPGETWEQARKRLQLKVNKGEVIERSRASPPSDNLPTIYGHDGEIHLAKALVKAAHGLTIHQTRLIRYAVSMIHPTAPQPSQLVVRIGAVDYAEKMGVKESKNFYRDLQEAADGLFHRYITITRETPTGRTIEKIHWVSSAKYHTGEGWVELRFSPEVSPSLSMLNNGDKIIYKLQSTVDLKSTYSWRLYELLMQWKDTKRLLISVEDYRHALEIPTTYRYTDIRAHCIIKPINELKEHCKIEVEFIPHKDKTNKRQVGSFEFTWKPVEQIEMPLEGGETPKKKRGRKPKEA